MTRRARPVSSTGTVEVLERAPWLNSNSPEGRASRVREGSFPLNNPDGYGLIGRTGCVERAWDPRSGRRDEHTVRSEHIQYFELLQYDVRIDGKLYSLNEDWLEEA